MGRVLNWSGFRPHNLPPLWGHCCVAAKKLYMWPHMKTCNAFFTVDNFRCHLVLGDDQVVGDGGQLFLGSGVTHLGLKLDTDLNSKNFISPCVTLQTMRFPEKTELK